MTTCLNLLSTWWWTIAIYRALLQKRNVGPGFSYGRREAQIEGSVPATIFREPPLRTSATCVLYRALSVLCQIEYDKFIVLSLCCELTSNCLKNKAVVSVFLFHVMLQCHSVFVYVCPVCTCFRVDVNSGTYPLTNVMTNVCITFWWPDICVNLRESFPIRPTNCLSLWMG